MEAVASSFRLRPSLTFFMSSILVFSALKSCHGVHTAFSFPDFSADMQKLTLLGDAQLLDSGLQISGSQAQSVGGLFYSQPVRLFRTGESMSFSSFFSFSMDANKGDGLAFVIAPSKEFHGMSGPWLGLSSSDDVLRPLAHTMAIEFDTSMNAEVHDPSENHVGLDIESLVSLATADVSDGFSLNDGEKLYAWIDYRAPIKTLEVRLSRSQAERPEKPILTDTIDLSNVWKEEMFVGFSSSTGDSRQRHVIYSWSFFTQDPHDWHDGPHDWHDGPHNWHHGTAVAGSVVLVWSLIRRCLRAADDAEQDVGVLYSYQELVTPDSDVKVDANGYQKLPTTEPQAKTESS